MATSTTPLLEPEPGETRHAYNTATSPESIAEEELTEEELAEYERGIISWRKARRFDFWFREEWRWGYAIAVVAIVLVTLMSVYHHRIIDWLEPLVRDLQRWKVGWLIPIGLIFILSFPPLFGNEIVILLVGVVWGLGPGTGIVAAGIVLGESATYAMFRYCCRGRAEQMTKKDLSYACLSQAITEGGFWMATLVRLSVIPTHFTTAVLAICGLRYRHFLAALVLGLPKQILAVFAIIAEKHPSTSSRVISDTVFVVTALITILGMRFIYKRMTAVRKKVLLAMRDDLQSKGVTVPSANDTSGSEDASSA